MSGTLAAAAVRPNSTHSRRENGGSLFSSREKTESGWRSRDKSSLPDVGGFLRQICRAGVALDAKRNSLLEVLARKEEQ